MPDVDELARRRALEDVRARAHQARLERERAAALPRAIDRARNAGIARERAARALKGRGSP